MTSNRKKQVVWGLLILSALAVSQVFGCMRDANEKRAMEKEAAALVETACDCAGGKVCEGPQGGRYCLTDGGKKRYLKAQP